MSRIDDHLSVLRRYNAWRTGEDERTMEEAGLSPGEITKAIRDAIAEIKKLRVAHRRYEALRRVNPRQFMDLWNRNLKGERFDALVDELAKS